MFLFEPSLNNPGAIWFNNHQNVLNCDPFLDTRAYKINLTKPNLTNEEINAVVMRSYKLVQVLTDRRNIKAILNGLSDYFNFLCKI